jgi:hypothetical protein
MHLIHQVLDFLKNDVQNVPWRLEKLSKYAFVICELWFDMFFCQYSHSKCVLHNFHHPPVSLRIEIL